MITPLLKTKFYIPPPRPNLVSRPRLIQRLDEGLRLGRRITLVSAPAGFGKTTLLSEWIASSERSVAWVSLDEGDNDPVRFLTYLVGALQGVDEAIGQSVEDILQSPQLASAATAPTDQVAWIEVPMAALISDVTAATAALVLVLDDYHLISAAPVHRTLRFLIDHQPPSMHIVISTREDPPLSLPRLRVRGQMTEVRERDLRFTEEEATAFLNRTMELHLSSEVVAALEARTEGWIAGLQLAALSLREREDASAFVAAFTGDDRHVVDYLIEEVLDRQPEAVQTFLLHTSILNRLSAPLCDALICDLGLPASSQEFLERLDATNLFLVPLDNRREWYRYHHLFADLLTSCLRQATSPERFQELHRRAGQWHQEHGSLEEAIKHTLAAQDFERAALTIGENLLTMLYRNEPPTLLTWIHKLPESVRSRPWINIYHAWTLALIGQADQAEALIQDTEQYAQPDGPGSADLLGIIAAARAYLASLRGDSDHAIELAHVAEEYLPEDNLQAHSAVALTLAEAHFARDDMDGASQALSHMMAIGKHLDLPLLTVLGMCDLASVKKVQGRLHEADDLYGQVHQLMLAQGGMRSRVSCPFEIGLGDLLRERNDLEAAHEHVVTGIELGQRFGLPSDLVLGYITLMRVLQARGDAGGALDALREAEQTVGAYDIHRSAVIQLNAWRIMQRLAVADLEAASRLANECGDSEPERIAVARVRVAQGRLDEALRLLDRQRIAAKDGGRAGRLVEILTLQAAALLAQGRRDQALTALEQALTLARPEGYVRLFLDAPIGELLRQLAAKGTAVDTVGQILAALRKERGTQDQGPGLGTSPSPPLVEPLSERELEVLRLLAVGLSNKEIAETLVIAASTVKQHLKNIYGKLDVHNRTQAANLARDLDLL